MSQAVSFENLRSSFILFIHFEISYPEALIEFLLTDSEDRASKISVSSSAIQCKRGLVRLLVICALYSLNLLVQTFTRLI
jgi:hypothetical protein